MAVKREDSKFITVVIKEVGSKNTTGYIGVPYIKNGKVARFSNWFQYGVKISIPEEAYTLLSEATRKGRNVEINSNTGKGTTVIKDIEKYIIKVVV